MQPQFSRRVGNLTSSPIREILEVIDRPGMISFAGGLPSPDSFPDFSVQDIPRSRLQYGPSEGDWDLRRCIAADLQRIGLDCPPEQVLVLSGSQQGIDMAAKLFVDPGNTVAVQSPTYLAALQVFRFYGALFRSYDSRSAAGMQIQGPGMPDASPRLLYSVPTFHNPTGHCCSREERNRIARFCDSSGTTLFEDDPYRDLVYDDCDRRPICSLTEQASWIYQSSFSKSLAPGLRLGFMAVSPDLLTYMTRLKQAADLHSSRTSQWLALQQLTHPERESRLARLAASYAAARDRFHALLTRYLGDLADWEIPPGGLFFWLTLRSPRDTQQLLAAAIARGVAFMPGEPFFPSPPERSCLRLNFSHASAEQAERGIQILAELLADAG